jgi:phenylacetic acid degradation operon negative regulatory protein
LPPLTARSVILSVLLGSHPPLLPVRSLVRTSELFGITEGTTRVALSRLVADAEVVADGSRYRLSDRLLARQRRQDEGRKPATRPWRGSWEMAVADPGLRAGVDRADLRAELAALRLAELRAGVWVRPANLRRLWPDSLQGRIWRFEARAVPSEDDEGHSTGPRASEGRRAGQGHHAGGSSGPHDGRILAATLWDLDGWAARAVALLGALAATEEPARRFVLAAAIVRHVQVDPLLPPSLLPARWPGTRLRAAYAGYEREVGRLLQRERARHDGLGPA